MTGRRNCMAPEDCVAGRRGPCRRCAPVGAFPREVACVRAFRRGMTLRALAAEFDISLVRVRHVLRRAGETMRLRSYRQGEQ